MLSRSLPVCALSLLLVSLGVSCSAEGGGVSGDASEGAPREGLSQVEQAVETKGDWSAYGSGQCVIGAQTFYSNRFGVKLKATGYQPGDVGNCLHLGACMYWVGPNVIPDPNVWNRYEWGSVMPQTYDLIIYPPKPGTTNYGHVASVDHMEGGDPGAYGNLYIMDSNFNGDEQKASGIHTFNRQPYGFYRLKSLTTCSAHCEGNFIVDNNCNKVDCGGVQSTCVQDGLGPHCVFPGCPSSGDGVACDAGKSIVSCHDGAVTGRNDCAASSQVCSVQGDLHCDSPPRGHLDLAGCDVIRGWAQDPSAADSLSDVHLYFGGPAGDPKAVGLPFQAGQHRDDLCAAIGSCAHGFAFPTPRSLLDGQPHEVHAYGIDLTGGPNVELGSLTFTCPSPSLPPNTVLRKLDDASFGLWKFSTFQDLAPPSDDPMRVGADMDNRGPDLPAMPRFVRADDGSAEVWLIDTGVRRLAPGVNAVAAWHATSIETWPAPKLYQVTRGGDLPQTPRIVQSEGPTYWLIDDSFLPADVVGSGEAGATGEAGPASPGGLPPGADAPGGVNAGASAGEQEASGCAVPAGRAGGPGGALGAALGLALLVSRKTRRQRAS